MQTTNPPIAVVTGANSGLGHAAAIGLASRGWEVGIVVRDLIQGEWTRRKIVKASNHHRVTIFHADLSLQSEVTRLLEAICSRYDRLDLLFNLAGASFPQRLETQENHELNWATNILGPFMLTEGLIDLLQGPHRGKVWNVAGDMHRKITPKWEDLEMKEGFSFFQMAKQIALTRIMISYEWSRKWTDQAITVNAFCPGWTRTRLTRHMNPWLRIPFRAMALLLAKSPQKAMHPILRMATDPELDKLTGKYFHLGQLKKSDPISYQPEACARLYQMVKTQTNQRKGSELEAI